MPNIKLDGKTEIALSHLQDTKLSPMEEALFRSWATANGIKKPDAPDDPFDYRGMYKMVGGKVLPFGHLQALAKKTNSINTLLGAVKDKVNDGAQTAKDQMDQVRSEQRQDVTHQQKMEQGKLQLAKAPYDLQSAKVKNEGKAIDVQGKQAMAEAQKQKTDQQLINALIPRTQPVGAESATAAETQPEPIGASPVASGAGANPQY